MLTGFAKFVPVGPKSKAVPFTTRGSLANAADGTMNKLVVPASASDGTAIWTPPDARLRVVPLTETMPPSSTVIVEVALFPSTAAVTVAVPGDTPATIPEDDTVAFVGSELVQVKTRCSIWPVRSVAVAENCTLAAGTRLAAGADIVTASVVGGDGGGGPVGLSPQEPISQPSAIEPMER
jgi:hypothetical protein